MSAFSKLKYYARKPVALIMAASLVTSTVPAVSLVQAAPAFAAEQRAQSTNHASKGQQWTDLSSTLSLTVDTHPSKGQDGTATATVSKDAILELVKAQETAKNQLTYSADGTNALSKAVNADLDKIQEDHADAKIATDSDGNAVVNAKLTGVTVEDVKADGEGVTVKAQDDGSWSIEVPAAVQDVTISFTVTEATFEYNFQYTYEEAQEPSEDTTPGEGSDEGTDEGTGDAQEPQEPQTETVTEWSPAEGKFSEGTITFEGGTALSVKTGAITATDVWAGVSDAIGNFEPTVSDLEYRGGEKASSATLRAPSGLDTEINTKGLSNREKKSFEAEVRYENGAYVVYVTPKRAIKDDLTFTIDFTYPDGKSAGTATVTVSPIAENKIDLSTLKTEKLDFRMTGDQEDEILEAANKLVSDKTHGEVDDYFESASFTTDGVTTYYAGATSEQSLGDAVIALTPRKANADDEDDYLNDYEISGQPIVLINAMETEDWSDPDDEKLASKLSITGDSLKDDVELTEDQIDPESGTWFRTNVTVAWDGGTVVEASGDAETPSADTTFGNTATMIAQAQGTQESSFFVKDDESGIVRRITGVKYLFDNTKPGLSAFEAVPAGEDYKSSDKQIWVAEDMSVRFITDEGAPSATKSGINNVDARYTEQGSSEAEEPKSLQAMTPSSTNGDVYTYEFDISADSKVSTDSIKVDLEDKAGNKNTDLGYKDTTTNIDVANLVAQESAPEISVSWDTSNAHNGSYYNTNRTLTLTVNAPFFEYTQQYLANHTMATITKDGSGWKTVTPGDFTKTGDDTWTCTISFTEDGDYEVSGVNATDVLGRTNTAAGDSFTIDKTAPRMQVTFDNNNASNGMYYNAARTATITITEHNFDPSLVNITPTAEAGNGTEVGQPSISGWTSNGDVHTATVTFPGQGVYTLSVDGMDLATNELTAYTCPEFVVDTLTPEITISNVENMTAYAGSVSPSVQVHDTNLDSATDIHVEVVGTSPYNQQANPFTTQPSMTATDATVSYGNPAELRANDNVYTVVVHAIDLAGNTSDDALTFSVNRFGSTYVISDETGKMLNEYLKFDDTTDVRVTEINPSGLDTSETAVELTRDTSNTMLTDDDYTTEHGSATGWQEYTYTVSRDNYDSDGVYRVLFHSEDVAGNISENEMEGKNAADTSASAQINFAVDDTAPLATFADLSNAEPYNESSHVAKVTFEDNLMLDHAVIEINGEEVATFDADALAQSATQEFTITESTGNQSIQVRVWDAAGNEGEASMDNVVVTTNPFELWRRNTPLFAATIAVAVLAAAGIIFVIVKKRSKDDEEEAKA